MTTIGPFALYLAFTLITSAATLFVATPAGAQSADATYSQNCAACHGAKGLGDGPAGKYLKPPPSDFATSLKGKTDDWIAKAIKGGGAHRRISYHAGLPSHQRRPSQSFG